MRFRASVAITSVICAINGLKVALSPFLPFTCEKLHTYLGYDTPLGDSGWALIRPPAGQRLAEPVALFTKLEAAVVDAEEERLAS